MKTQEHFSYSALVHESKSARGLSLQGRRRQQWFFIVYFTLAFIAAGIGSVVFIQIVSMELPAGKVPISSGQKQERGLNSDEWDKQRTAAPYSLINRMP